MKIAITGATGFIGKHLVLKHLEKGDEVQILSRKEIEDLDFPKSVKVFNHNLLDDEKLLEPFVNNVDILYHCAAEIKDDQAMYDVNVGGTKNLIAAAKGKVKHWVQLSSTGVYGPVFTGVVDEKYPLNPINTYEKSKVESDKLVIEAGANNLFTYSILRPSNVFGADMRNQSLFQLVKAVDKGMFFFIGPKGANANYVTVENVVDALVKVGTDKKAQGKIYNVSDVTDLESFIQVIAKALNKPVPKTRLPLFLMRGLGMAGNVIPKIPLTTGRVDALTNRVVYINDLIEKELNYVSVKSIKDGMEDLVAAYKRKNLR